MVGAMVGSRPSNSGALTCWYPGEPWAHVRQSEALATGAGQPAALYRLPRYRFGEAPGRRKSTKGISGSTRSKEERGGERTSCHRDCDVSVTTARLEADDLAQSECRGFTGPVRRPV